MPYAIGEPVKSLGSLSDPQFLNQILDQIFLLLKV